MTSAAKNHQLKVQPRTIDREVSSRRSPYWKIRHSGKISLLKNKIFLSFKKLKNWKIVPVAVSLFLILAKEFWKFTSFLQKYQVLKSKLANLCNIKWQKLSLPPTNHQPPFLPSRWENPEDLSSPRYLPHNFLQVIDVH